MVGAEVQRGLMGGGCGDGSAAFTPVKVEEPSASVESTGISFSSFWDWHKVGCSLASPVCHAVSSPYRVTNVTVPMNHCQAA